METPSEAQNQESPPPAATPVADKALARVRALATGNGIDPANITLARVRETVEVLQAEILLSPQWEVVALAAGSKEFKQQARLPVTKLENAEALRGFAAKRAPAGWLDECVGELANLPAQGWGVSDKRIIIDSSQQLLLHEQICRACAGQGTIVCPSCSGKGHTECFRCQGTQQDPEDRSKPCTECTPEGQPVLYSYPGFIVCRTCRGNRRITCKSCGGKGKLQEHHLARYVVALDFRLVSNLTAQAGQHALPSPLLRAIDRAGLARLANGHATIKRVGVGVDSRGSGKSVVHFEAHIPYAELRLVIDGTNYDCIGFGHKAAVLELKPFLDDKLAAALQAGKTPSMRVFADAVPLAAKGFKPNSLLSVYPAGISASMADQVFAFAKKHFAQSARRPRVLAMLAASAAAGALCVVYFTLGLRGTLLGIWPNERLDYLFPVIMAALAIAAGHFGSAWWLGKKLKLGGLAKQPWPHLDWLLPLILVPLLHYAALQAAPVKPLWWQQQQVEKQLAARIEALKARQAADDAAALAKQQQQQQAQ